MKKIIFILLVVNVFLFSADIKNKVTISIPKQDSKIIKIPALDLKVGESGIITREINNNVFILGIAIVNKINKEIANIEVKEFKNIKDKYMPTPLGEPKEGDKITFRILYDKVLLLAPNQSTYQDIIADNKKIDFIHPDIFLSYLANNEIDEPKHNDFLGFCNKFDIGLIFITKRNELDVFDCQSFKIIAKDSIKLKDISEKKPFFMRISDESLDELFDLKKMKKYFDYYGTIKENN